MKFFNQNRVVFNIPIDVTLKKQNYFNFSDNCPFYYRQMDENKKQNFLERFSKRYIIVVYNQGNFKERISISLTPINLILALSSLVVFAGILTWLLIVFTPIKSSIPGFNNSYQSSGNVFRLQNRVDSLENALIQERKIEESLRIFLKGDTGKTSYNRHNMPNTVFHLASWQQDLRDGSNNLTDKVKHTGDTIKKNLPIKLFPPVIGYISQHYNPEEDHYALDIVTEKDAPVKAVDDGMVVFSEWSAETGNVIIIQHSNNLISICKHNSVLLKKVGTFVNRGEVIALVGNSGDYTNGPHLHFELWAEGSPMDPENFISF